MAASVGVATPYAARVRHSDGSSSSSSSDSSSDSSSSSSSDEGHAGRRRPSHHHHELPPAASSPISIGSSVASPTLNPAVLSAKAHLANAAEWERKKLFVDAARTSGTVNEEKPKTGPIVTQLMADVCDLAIPASKVGWYKNKEVVSLAYLLSSVLAGSVIWGRVNAKTTTHEQKGSHPGIKMVKRDEYEVRMGVEERKRYEAELSARERMRYEARIEEERRKTSSSGHGQLAAAAGVGLAAGLAAGAVHERKSAKSKHEAGSSSAYYEESKKTSGRSKSETGYDVVHMEDERRRSSSSQGHGHIAAAGAGVAAGLAVGAIAGSSNSRIHERSKSEAGFVSSTHLEEERRRKSTSSAKTNLAAAAGAGAAAGYVAGAIAEGSSSSGIHHSQSQSEFSSSTRIEEERRKQSAGCSQANLAATVGLATGAGIAAGYAAGAITEGNSSSKFGYSHQSQSEFSSTTHLEESSSSYAQGSSSYAHGTSNYAQGSSYGQEYAGYQHEGNSYGQAYTAGAIGAGAGAEFAAGAAAGCRDAGRSHSVAGRIEDSSYQRELEQQRELDQERLSRAASTADVSTIVDVDVTASMTEATAASIANKSKKRTGYGGWSYDDDGGAGGLNETHWTQNGGSSASGLKAEEDEQALRARIQSAKDISDMDVTAGGTGQLKPYSTITYAKVTRDGDKDGCTVDL